MPSPASLSDAALLQQTMLFFQLEQRHRLAAEGSHTHQRMLLVLRRRGPLPQSEVARIMALEKSWISRAVDKLVAAGWVSREPDPGDRRSVRLVLSDSGRAQAEAMSHLLEQHAATVLARLDEAAQAQVMQAMRLLNAVLEPPARPPRDATEVAA